MNPKIMKKKKLSNKAIVTSPEEKAILDSLYRFFQKYQYSLFLSSTADETKLLNEFIGYRKNTNAGTVFCAYPERFKETAEKEIGINARDVLRIAAKLGILEREPRHMTKMVRIKNKVIRMLVFNANALIDAYKNLECTEIIPEKPANDDICPYCGNKKIIGGLEND
jgi:hypothetical protein